MPTRDTRQDAFIRANFSSIWPVHLTEFTRLLTRLRARFDGDLDLLLVMAVIGERTRPDSWAPEVLTYRHLTRSSQEERLQYPINIQSVADFCGMPRETARRKIGILVGKGWVVRNAAGHLAVSPTAAKELEDATSDSVAYLAALLAEFESAQQREGGTSRS